MNRVPQSWSEVGARSRSATWSICSPQDPLPGSTGGAAWLPKRVSVG